MSHSFFKNFVVALVTQTKLPIRLILVCTLFIFLSPFRAQAQFYDSVDEVRFYVYDDAFSNPAKWHWLVFNFNGEKAAVIEESYYSSCHPILEDENYFEKKILNPRQIGLYNYNKVASGGGKVVYGSMPVPFPESLQPGKGFYNACIFTDDGQHLELITNVGGGAGQYTRVSKETFIELYLAHLNKKNESWR